jgi:hypothetical protein
LDEEEYVYAKALLAQLLGSKDRLEDLTDHFLFGTLYCEDDRGFSAAIYLAQYGLPIVLRKVLSYDPPKADPPKKTRKKSKKEPMTNMDEVLNAL